MPIAEKKTTEISPVALKKLVEDMQEFASTSHKRASKTAMILDAVKDEIVRSRRSGTSWTLIASFINGRMGTKLHPSTIRSYIEPKHKPTLTEEAQGAADLSQMRPAPLETY